MRGRDPEMRFGPLDMKVSVPHMKWSEKESGVAVCFLKAGSLLRKLRHIPLRADDHEPMQGG